MISAANVAVAVGHFSIDVSVDINDNEYFVLLGMTGSGKTLFLESICGLRKLESGTIKINGADVTNLEPKDRFVGYVPQDGALFEHLTVAENIGFSPTVRGLDKHEILHRAEEIAEKIGITHLLKRKIKGLSGGERQRVALSRALASKPSVLVMDEPVSALDEYTREGVCRELKKIQRDLGISVIHVCHSFEEAKLVGDRIGIMHLGRILQTGTAAELLQSPATETAANILRLGNIFRGTSDGNGYAYVNNFKMRIPEKTSGNIAFVIRPWEVRFTVNDISGETDNVLHGDVSEILPEGIISRIRINSELPITGYISNSEIKQQNISIGSVVNAIFGASSVHIFG